MEFLQQQILLMGIKIIKAFQIIMFLIIVLYKVIKILIHLFIQKDVINR